MTALSKLLAKSRDLENKRTPGEWLNRTTHGPLQTIETIEQYVLQDDYYLEKEDAEFIAHVANTHAKLLQIIEVQAAVLEKSLANCPGPQGKELPAFYCPGCDAREALARVEEICLKL